jgi:flavin-binding protein dodecin
MSVAKVTEISSTSTKSFEDAINSGLARAHKTIRNIKSAWIKEQQVRLDKGANWFVLSGVNLILTFVLEINRRKRLAGIDRLGTGNVRLRQGYRRDGVPYPRCLVS